MESLRQEAGKRRYHATEPLRCGEWFCTSFMDEVYSCTPQYALVYLSSGSGRFTSAAGEVYELAAGDAFQRFPNEPHSVSYSVGTWRHSMAVPAEVYEMMRQNGLPTIQSPVISPGLNHGFEKRQRNLAHKLREEQPRLIMRTLTELQALMVDMHIQAILNSTPEEDFIGKACDYLGSNFNAEISMDEYARSLGVSYSLFRKKFRQEVGMSPGQYRLRRKLEKAQELLLQGKSVGGVADELGYTDIYAFSAQFKKHCRVPPSKFVQQF